MLRFSVCVHMKLTDHQCRRWDASSHFKHRPSEQWPSMAPASKSFRRFIIASRVRLLFQMSPSPPVETSIFSPSWFFLRFASAEARMWSLDIAKRGKT